jgi:WhiB family transcriptional regulator, redox-sensing transcriptional regulator
MSITSKALLQRRQGAAGIDWRNYAACRDVDPDLFFPLGTAGASLPQIEQAKQVCRTCPVSKPCLCWALDNGDAGVWGGTTEEERRGHRQSRALGESGSAEDSSRFSAILRILLFPVLHLHMHKSWSPAWLQLAGIRLVRLSGGTSDRQQG